ncbi:hypothetical protein [Cypionkella sp.]|uniref:hypothetical protein n=1 Tax=Cypionkella sp. TaxID=2811411 RepID=UPI002AB88611|nr:hypothetical protein [Cypionkella sp.]MDZ4393797.1 hypothetical protein [Cypionkella sp.]
MSHLKKLSVGCVEVHGGWPRGRVILSDGSELDGVLSLGYKLPVHPLAPPQVLIEAIVRGQFPESASSVDRMQQYASEIFVGEDGIYISSIDPARGRTVWAGPFKLVSDAGEPAAIVGFEGHFIKTFESGFIP